MVQKLYKGSDKKVMQLNSKILITGGNGLVGRALRDELAKLGYQQVFTPTSQEYNLCDFSQTRTLFESIQPDYVFHLAAAVYGIWGNMQNKAKSFLDNTLMNTHVVEMAHRQKVKKIVAMGTGAMYPYPSPGLPLKEEMIWSGRPHGAEDSYGQAKRAMLAQLEAYHENYGTCYALVVSGNLFGPHDKFDIEFGHVTPALIRKFYEAKLQNTPVTVWGDGSARRDFLFSKDVARALMAIMEQVEGSVNMGSGQVFPIRRIVEILAAHTGLENKIIWDSSKPNGQDYRAYDLSKLQATGFKPLYSFEDSIRATYDWYAAHARDARKM